MVFRCKFCGCEHKYYAYVTDDKDWHYAICKKCSEEGRDKYEI